MCCTILATVCHTMKSDDSQQISQAVDVYVPRGIQSVDLANADIFVDAAINNFDQNEENHHPFHGCVLYQRCETLTDDESIPRTGKKALDVTEYTEEPLHRYTKPQHRPESLLKVDKAVIAKGKDKDMVWELARFASKEIHTIPAWNDFNAMTSDKTVPVATIRYLPFIYAPSKDLSSIHDFAEVGGYSREAGAASHSRHRRLDHIPQGTADTVKQARVPSRESDNATWWHASHHGIHCQYWTTCWRDHTQSSNHWSLWSAQLPTLPKMISRQGRPVCICVRINCCQCNTSTHWSGEIVKIVIC